MTKENNYISSLLIKSLRGKRTAAQMSRVLGYSSNQVNRWESSHSLITWESLIDFCIKRDVDVKKNLYAAFAYTGKVESVKDIILFFTGKKLNKEIAETLGISTSTISNWINGKTPPIGRKNIRSCKAFKLFIY
ncbi:MAG: helix-turn-helix domain-containing protein [Oligoflexia bacterium]|nr:helix-turn-helix domain-containing protein [Oligoflexia bacterium]